MIRHLLTLTVALSFVSSFAAAALSPSDKQSISYENRAAAVNSGFENGISKWVSSPAITLASATPQAGSKYAQWDSTSAAQTLTLGSIGRPEGQLEVSCAVRVPSGTATHTFSVVESSGSTTVASMSIENSTTWRYQTLIFPSPSAGTLSIVFTSVASNEPSIDIDDCYVGRARGVGSAQLTSEWTSYTPTGTWSSNTTYTGQWRRVGDTLEMRAKLVLSGAPTSATLSVNLPSAANCTIDTNKIPTTVADYAPILGEGIARDNATAYYNINVVYNNTTSVLPITKKVSGSYISQEAVTQAAPFTFGSSDAIEFSAKVPCVGWSASTVVMPDAQGWWAGANISGANVSLGTSAQSSYVELTNASLSMTQKSGSATAWIPCSSTNAATGTTCSSGNEGLGIVVTIPKTGVYRACAQFAHYVDSPAGSVNVESVFQLVQTAINSQTILQEGGGKQYSGEVSFSGDRRSGKPLNVCGTFTLSAGQTAIRLMYEQDIAGTPDNNYIPADASGTYGQRDFDIVIYPIQNQSNALLANSVNTSAQNGIREESSTFTCSGSSSIGTQLGGVTWLSSIGNISSGACAVVFAAGTPASTPQCFATWSGGGSNSMLYTYLETSSGFSIGGVTDTGAASTSFTGKVTCKWAR